MNSKSLSKYLFSVISGQRFAMLEEKIVLSRIIQKFNLETTQTVEELEPTIDLVLKPSNGIRVKLSHR